MIRDTLNDAWNHSRAIRVSLANGDQAYGIPQRVAEDAEWCKLNEHSRFHTEPMKTHHVRISEITAVTEVR